MAFAAVGIVEVRGPVTASQDDFVNGAVAKGTELGCDVLVHQYFYELRPGPRRHFNGVAAWLFTCGVLDPTKPAAETARLADAAAVQIVRAEYGEPACSTEAPTGTHLRRDICWLPGIYRTWNNGKRFYYPEAR